MYTFNARLQAESLKWVGKTPSLPRDKRLYNIMADNSSILNKILRTSRKQVEHVNKAYSNPKKIETILSQLISKGFIITDQTTDDIAKYKDNIGQAFRIGLEQGKSTPKPIMNIVQSTTQDSVMKYVTNLDATIKQEMANILTTGYAEQKLPKDIIKDMVTNLRIKESRARMISTTETMRSSNAASWGQNKAEGTPYYIVDSRGGACEDCQNEYEGVVFSIDDVSSLPPLHPWCACVPMFYDDKGEAQDMSDTVVSRNELEREMLKDQGYTLPADGTGPNVTGSEYQSIVKEVPA